MQCILVSFIFNGTPTLLASTPQGLYDLVLMYTWIVTGVPGENPHRMEMNVGPQTTKPPTQLCTALFYKLFTFPLTHMSYFLEEDAVFDCIIWVMQTFLPELLKNTHSYFDCHGYHPTSYQGKYVNSKFWTVAMGNTPYWELLLEVAIIPATTTKNLILEKF